MDTTFPLKLHEKAAAGIEERKKLIPTIFWLDYYLDIAPKQGLLALSDEQEFYNNIFKDNFLTIGINLVLSGIQDELLSKILLTTLYATNCEGIEALKRMIIYHGVFAISNGENIESFHSRIYPTIGPEIIEIMDTEMSNTIESLYKKLNEKEGGMYFEELTEMYDYEVRRILEMVSPDIVIPLLRGGKSEVRDKIFTNLNRLKQYNFLYLLFSQKTVETSISDFLFAQQKFDSYRV